MSLIPSNLTIPALVCFSEEVRSRCHVKHTLPRWPVETGGVGDSSGGADPLAPNAAGGTQSGAGGQNVRRQKSWDMLDQSAIQYARQSHKVQPHQVSVGWKILLGRVQPSEIHFTSFRVIVGRSTSFVDISFVTKIEENLPCTVPHIFLFV